MTPAVPHSTFSAKQQDALDALRRNMMPFDVTNYGAKGNGADDTTAWQTAAAALRAYHKTAFNLTTPTSWTPLGTYPAFLYAPPGYVGKITGSINLQGIAGLSWGVWGYGAVVYGVYAGVLFDCLGSRWGQFRGLTIIGDANTVPTIGILYGCNATNTSNAEFLFDRIMADGFFSDSVFHNLQSEIDLYTNCFAYNRHASGACVLLDGNYHVPVVSAFTSPVQPADTYQSFIQHTFHHCAFLSITASAAAVGTAVPVQLYDPSQIAFEDSYIATSVACVQYQHLASAPTPQNLKFDFHGESSQTNNIVFVRTASGVVTIDGFELSDGASQATDCIVKAGTNVTALILRGGRVSVFGNPLNATPFGTAAFFFGLYQDQPISQYGVGDQSFDLGTLYSRGAVWGFVVPVLTAPRTWTLPPASAGLGGSRIKITDTSGGITNVNTLTLARAGADLISGATSLPIVGPYATCELETDGVSNWTIISLETAWTDYTFTPTTSIGTLTTASGAGRYQQSMRTIKCTAYSTITTNGTGAGVFQATAPLAAAQRNKGAGREDALTGAELSVLVVGSTLKIFTSVNAYPGGDGALVNVSIQYEI